MGSSSTVGGSKNRNRGPPRPRRPAPYMYVGADRRNHAATGALRRRYPSRSELQEAAPRALMSRLADGGLAFCVQRRHAVGRDPMKRPIASGSQRAVREGCAVRAAGRGACQRGGESKGRRHRSGGREQRSAGCLCFLAHRAVQRTPPCCTAAGVGESWPHRSAYAYAAESGAPGHSVWGGRDALQRCPQPCLMA